MKALILLTIVAIVNAVELKFYDTAECSGKPTGSAVYQVSETVSFENYKKLNQQLLTTFYLFFFLSHKRHRITKNKTDRCL